MRVLITGASGMLGATLADKWKGKFDIFATGKNFFINNPANKFKAYDLLNESYDVLIDWAKPDVIVHCAAITNVDYCEDYPEQAMAVNTESVNKFFKSNENTKLIFISSDAVFSDGVHMASEKDETDPENVYGMSKSLAEKYIQNKGKPHAAIRTTIVGKNINLSYQGFVEWIINSIKNGKEITLFDDALFTPITVWSLADELEWIIENNISGIIHIAGKESVSKYDFGMKICDGLGLDTSLILRGSIDTVTFKAKRSKDQTMDSSRYQELTGRTLPTTIETVDLIIQNFEEPTYA
jgi:dTDP-4-dehydrorhamnose reductase